MRFIRFLQSAYVVSIAFSALLSVTNCAQANGKKPVIAARQSAAVKNPVADKSLFSGSWQVVSIRGEATVVGNRGTLPEIQFRKSGISGQSGCNGFGGPMQLKGTKVKFGAMSATLMACSGPLMKQEQALYQAFSEAEEYHVGMRPAANKTGKKRESIRYLTFLNARGRAVLILERK